LKGKMIGSWRKVLLASVAAAWLLAGLTACSGSRSNEDSSSNAAKMSVANQEAAPAEMDALSMSEMAPVASAEVSSKASSPEATQVYAGGGSIGPIADANAGYGRKVIYRADLVMKVEKFRVAEEQLYDQIHLSGAYVLQFSDSRNSNEIGATYVIKVPSEGFSSFLEKLQKIESLKFEREVQGNDVTEEFVDLEARLKTQTTLEARYLDFMNKATKTGDLVQFANELAQVQGTIEQIKGRMRYLDQNVAYSTVNLRLYQASVAEEVPEDKPEEKGFGARLSDALLGSADVLRKFGEGLLVALAAMLPVLLVVAAIGGPLYFAVRKRGVKRRRASEEKRKTWNRDRLESQEVEKSEIESFAGAADANGDQPSREDEGR